MTSTRLAMSFVLLLVLLAQGWGLVSVWREDPLHRLAAEKKKEVPPRAAIPEKIPSMQPLISGVQPDLNTGYIFNVERNLAGGDGADGQAQGAAREAMDKVQYNGSIIAGNDVRALLSYPVAGPGTQQKQGFLRVVVGDTVNGYLVAEILPEKIIFSRGGQKITKLLRDKTRAPAAPPPAGESGVPLPAPPSAQQSPARTNPAPILSPPPRPVSPRNDEVLREKPLRKRPEPPKETQAPMPQVLTPAASREAAPAQPETGPK